MELASAVTKGVLQVRSRNGRGVTEGKGSSRGKGKELGNILITQRM